MSSNIFRRGWDLGPAARAGSSCQGRVQWRCELTVRGHKQTAQGSVSRLPLRDRTVDIPSEARVLYPHASAS
jgi:hypothetical protein